MTMGLMEKVDEMLPLSPTQTGMLFECIADGALPGTYVAALAIDIDGVSDLPRFQAAMEDEIRSHDALRCAFFWEGLSQPVQLVHKAISVPWDNLDWSAGSDHAHRLAALIAQERNTGLDLRHAPLMRVKMIKTAAQRYTLVWVVHHLIADGWSVGVVLDGVMDRYVHGQARSAQRPLAQFRHYLEWEQAQDETAARAFWTSYLEGMAGPTRPAAKLLHAGDAPAREHVDLSHAQTAALKTAAKDHRTTQANLLTTLWSLVLRRYTAEDDVIFGQTNAGRPAGISGIDRAVGPFIKTLPVRVTIDPNQSFADLVRHTEARGQERRRFEQTPLPTVTSCAPIAPGTPLFETLFVVEDGGMAPHNSGDLTVTPLLRQDASGYGLVVLAHPGDTWAFEAIVQPGAPAAHLARAMLEDLSSLLDAALADPSRGIGDLARTAWTKLPPEGAALSHPSILDRILHWCETNPDATAIADATKTLSYRDLDRRSRAIASALQAQSIGDGDIVPIALERGADYVAAQIGVMRAGAAYTPLDLSYPKDRLERIIAAVEPRVVLTSASGGGSFADTTATILDIETCTDEDAALPPAPDADQRAYVIFTSGSQGLPKGVEITHGNLAYSMGARADVFPAAPTAFLMASSFAFDSSVIGVFWTLTSGGKVVVTEPRAEQDMSGLGRMIRSEEISHLLCLPSLYHALLVGTDSDDLSTLSTVIVAGEAVAPVIVQDHFDLRPETGLFNEYGPTEATVWCAAARLGPDHASGNIPIGSPARGTYIRVVDADGVPLPPGALGEFAIAGPGLSRGYLNAADQTSAAFRMIGGTRHYMTGDFGFETDEGAFVFLGRRDSQIKIRGHRVELSEIAASLRAIAGDLDVAVIATSAPNHDIFGFVAGPIDAAQEIAQSLTARLPAFMTPRAVLPVDTIPQLPNGKTDQTALGKLAATYVAQPTGDAPPQTFTEIKLAEIWSAVLGIETISRDANFFDLGGDSLNTIAVALKAEDAGLHLAPHEMFDFPSLFALAAHLHARAEALSSQPIEKNLAHANADGDKPVFFMIHGSPRMYSYLNLTLGKRRPLGFLFSHFLAGDITPDTDLSELVDDALEKLRAIRPSGPYHLGGYSMGGVIALELARRLRQTGETVQTLFLLDPSYTVGGLPNTMDLSFTEVGQRVTEGIVGRVKMLEARVKRKLSLGDHDKERMQYVGAAYRRILSKYRPTIYEGDAILMMTPLVEERAAKSGWLKQVLPNAEHHSLPYDHVDLQRNPDALMAWTSQLSARLKQAEQQK